MNNIGKEVEIIKKNERKVLGLKNTRTEMNNETGKLTSDQKQLKGELDNRRQDKGKGAV